MGTAGDLRADDGRLGTEEVSKDLFQRIPAHIVITIAGGGGKMAVCDHVLLEGLEDAAGAMLLNGINASKLLLQRSFRAGNAFLNGHNHAPCVKKVSSLSYASACSESTQHTSSSRRIQVSWRLA